MNWLTYKCYFPRSFAAYMARKSWDSTSKELCLTFSGLWMSAVDSLYKMMRRSKQMRNSWRGLWCSMKTQQLQLLLHFGEIRSEGILIFRNGCTAAFINPNYIMHRSCVGVQQCRYHILTDHSDRTVLLFRVLYKIANNSHNEHNCSA